MSSGRLFQSFGPTTTNELIFAVRCYAGAALVVMRCLSVCVCVSVTFLDCVKMNKHIFKIFSPLGSHTILVFLRTKCYGNIPTGTPLKRASNAGGVGRHRDSEPKSGFTACCQRFRRPDVINTTPPDHGPASYITYHC